MRGEWPKKELKDLLEIVIDHRGKTPNKMGFDDFHKSGYPVLSAKHVKTDEIVNIDGFRFANSEMYKKWMRVEIEEGDIALTSEAPMGEVFYLDGKVKYVLGQRVFGLRPKKQIIYPLYLSAWLTSKRGQEQLASRASGSTVLGIKQSELLKIEVDVPPYDIQVKIANLRYNLIKKISLNKKTNETLEQISQALFKSWFIDFDPVKAKADGCDLDIIAHDLGISKEVLLLFPDEFEESELGFIPKGWSISNIDDICEFQNGYAFKSKEMIKTNEGAYKVFKMGGIKKGGGLNKSNVKDYFYKSKCKNLGRYLIKKGDLLMCMTDMKNNVALLGHTALMDVSDEFILNQRVGLLRTKNKFKANYSFLYILTNTKYFVEDLRSRANSGVQVNLSTSEIKNTNFVLPSQEIHQAFDKLVEIIQEKIFSLKAQDNYLIELRDTLLPKLLSGEITIESADKIN